MTFEKIAILGPGLLGGSIALAFRERAPETRIALWARREAAIAELRERRIADLASTDLEAVAKDADAVIFCVPIGIMPALADRIAPVVPRRALITDVGSVKAPVARALAPIFDDRARFIGSHPMAGSEQAGLSAARADLFQNAVCILTPEASTDASATADARELWVRLGCRVLTLSPQEHDEAVALVSHLPHLVAAALVNTARAANPVALELCGSGFRDTTRIAAGPPAMWAEILRENRGPLKDSVNAMIEKLRAMVTLLDSGDTSAMEQSLAEAKTERDRLKNFPQK